MKTYKTEFQSAVSPLFLTDFDNQKYKKKNSAKYTPVKVPANPEMLLIENLKLFRPNLKN